MYGRVRASTGGYGRVQADVRASCARPRPTVSSIKARSPEYALAQAVAAALAGDAPPAEGDGGWLRAAVRAGRGAEEGAGVEAGGPCLPAGYVCLYASAP